MPGYLQAKHLAAGDPHSILEVCFLLLREHAQHGISVQRCHELRRATIRRTKQVGRTQRLTGSQILLKWMSKFVGRQITNFRDIADGSVLLAVLRGTGNKVLIAPAVGNKLRRTMTGSKV